VPQRSRVHSTTTNKTQRGAAAAAPFFFFLSRGCRFSLLSRVDSVVTLYYNTFAAAEYSLKAWQNTLMLPSLWCVIYFSVPLVASVCLSSFFENEILSLSLLTLYYYDYL
jgi:hypothetical protein